MHHDQHPDAETEPRAAQRPSRRTSTTARSQTETQRRVTAQPAVYSILIVEDDLHVRESLVDLFELAGFNVRSAENGRDGLRRIREQIPDLVIADIMMPVMDGVTMLRRIRAQRATSLIPVILLTARHMLESRLEGLETGADDYITKPFHARELIARVTNMIQTRKNLLLALYSEPSRVLAESQDETFLRRLRGILEERMGNPDLNIDQVCDDMKLGRSTIQKRLKHITGKSFNRYLRDFRLERARDLLAGNAGTISDIAFQLGFNSLSYFSRAYKGFHGVPPRHSRH
jgi:DNA-binding response OmpR family regulator